MLTTFGVGLDGADGFGWGELVGDVQLHLGPAIDQLGFFERHKNKRLQDVRMKPGLGDVEPVSDA